MLLTLLRLCFGKVNDQHDTDWFDYANYCLTPKLLLLFAMVLATRSIIGQPIQCYAPAHFTAQWIQYTEDYCFVENTYFIRWDEDIPHAVSTRTDRELNYYQWVPIVLALQALFFYVPNLVWKTFSLFSGYDIFKLVQTARKADLSGDKRQLAIEAITGRIKTACKLYGQRNGGRGRSYNVVTSTMHSKNRYVLGAHFRGTYLCLVVMLVKFLYICNLIGQFFLLSRFLQMSFASLWGTDIADSLVQGRDWQETGVFPRVTMCDFEVRVLGNINRHSVQCVIMVNMLHEKAYVFIWFWFFILSCLTIIGFLIWIIDTFTPFRRGSFIRDQLYISRTDMEGIPDEHMVEQFMNNWLRIDGVLALRFVANNAGRHITIPVLKELFDGFLLETIDDNTEFAEFVVDTKNKASQPYDANRIRSAYL